MQAAYGGIQSLVEGRVGLAQSLQLAVLDRRRAIRRFARLLKTGNRVCQTVARLTNPVVPMPTHTGQVGDLAR